ncbi:MAG TPA: hypothetical protein VKK31_29185 [Thermoanaerobaculia bacterium]|nr:hypothetical protein [Thermoanaerobaculia bacterium]
MSASVWQWPALDLQGQSAPRKLEAGLSVWGKVHGAASDFRWIAHSPGLEPQARRLELELLLGSEDAPERATFWRALGASYCAVSSYPSRAMDAARRSGFLEKQLLEWTPSQNAPAALGALLLLPQVARFTDEIWWSRSDDPGWTQPGFALTLKPGDVPSLAVNEDALARIVETGCAALRDAVEESALAAFYSSLLAQRRPAILSGLVRPLPPEALAALLLPLPRKLADRLSMAGWVVSQRVDPESFTRLWDALLCDGVPASLRTAAESEVTDPGRESARAVLSGAPPRSGRPSAPSSSPSSGTPEALDRLLEFVADEERRWLKPEELAGGRPLRFIDDQAAGLEYCLEQVRNEAASLDGGGDAGNWQRDHLRVKADLVRAAALALAPATVERLGLPETRRVPALLFCTQLDPRNWDELAARLGDTVLDKALRQSLSCQPDLFGGLLRGWLAKWRQRTPSSRLTRLLDQL